MSAALSPAERRGYPLPPWAIEPCAAAEHNGADVLEYLLDLVRLRTVSLAPAGIRQAEAYLEAWLERHRGAQLAASRCALEDHAGQADELEGLRAELADARAAVRDAYNAGHAAGVEYAAARTYVDGHLPDDVVDLLEQLEHDEQLGDELLTGAGYEPLPVIDARTLGDVYLVNKCPRLCPCDTTP